MTGLVTFFESWIQKFYTLLLYTRLRQSVVSGLRASLNDRFNQSHIIGLRSQHWIYYIYINKCTNGRIQSISATHFPLLLLLVFFPFIDLHREYFFRWSYNWWWFIPGVARPIFFFPPIVTTPKGETTTRRNRARRKEGKRNDYDANVNGIIRGSVLDVICLQIVRFQSLYFSPCVSMGSQKKKKKCRSKRSGLQHARTIHTTVYI